MILNFKGSSRFKKEVEDWLNEGLITTEQAEKLYLKYDLLSEPPWYLRSSFIITSIALLFAAMGMMLIISENWNDLNTIARMVICLLPLLIAQGIAVKGVFENKQSKTELAVFFSCLALFANICLQAQIFHISSYFPNSFLWWALGCIPLAFLLRSTLIQFVVQFAFGMWLFFEIDYHQFSVITPILFVAMLYLLYNKPNGVVLLASILNLTLFVINIIVVTDLYQGNTEITFLFGSLALLVISLTGFVKHQYSEGFINRIEKVAVFISIFIFYLYTWEDLTEEFIGDPISYITYAIFGIAFILYIIRERSINILIAFSLVFFTFLFQFADPEKDVVVVNSIANFIFFLLCAWNIFSGIHNKFKQQFMFGIFLLISFALSKYISLFGDYITTAIIFILSGAALLLINNYWNKKYEMP